MASTRGEGESAAPRRDALDDTVPAKGESGPKPPSVDTQDAAPIRPTIPIDRYRIGKELGRGGMGRVVEAFDVQLGRTVALKEVLPKAGGGTHRRFAREIHITARLEHPSIVPLYDSGINSDGKPYYVMRRVSGQPLDEMISGKRSLDDRLTLLPAVLAAIDAVAHAHDRGVIHRDLKPANILVGEHGETIVIDWGLAKVVGEDDDATAPPIDDDDDPSPSDSLKTQIGSVFGTPGFMSPEQARGEELDLQGDVYALGAVLYQVLAGAPPVAGVSATEVMDKTRTHDIKPLSETAPGAPRELVAIVDKAHAFDPINRYPNAGALAADVRRFLAGQLVAAHDYTNVQRLARFARRHRGVLSAIAIATVAGAVMAWIGVARIVTERDAANQARSEADAGKREAEETRDRLSERHDQLVLAQAKALVETNPTEAIAYLKQLPATSTKLDEGRAIAQAATMRGVAWAVQTSAIYNFWASQDFDGRLLATSSRDGTVRVIELDRRRLLVARTFAPDTRADWVFGNKLLLTQHSTAPLLFDPKTNTIEPLALPMISFVRTTASGDRAVVTLAAKPRKAAFYDAATRTLAPIEFPEEVDHVEIAPDGSWTVVSGNKLVMVLDRDGKEVKRYEGTPLRFQTSTTGKIGIQIDIAKVVESTVTAQTPWSEVPLALTDKQRVIDFGYRGDHMLLYLSSQDVVGWNGTTTYRMGTSERWTAGMVEAGEATMIVPTLEGKLWWFNELGRGTLVLPEPLRQLRIVARPGSNRIAVVGDGVVFVYDLSLVIPRRYPADRGTRAQFLDDDNLIVLRPKDSRWQFLDLANGKRTDIQAEALMPEIWDIDESTGRVLVRDVGPQQRRFWLFRRGSTKGEVIIDGARAWAQLVDGDAVIYGHGDDKVFALLGNAPPKQVAKVDGVVHRGAGIGQLVYAVRSNTGEVLRGDLATGQIERVRVPTGINGFLAADARGRVLLAEDNRLLVWDGQVSEIARFDKPIGAVAKSVDGAIVFVGADMEVFALKMTQAGGAPQRIIARAPNGVAYSNDGRLVGAYGNGQMVNLVELPSLARWNLPSLTHAIAGVNIAPKSRKVLQMTGSAIVIWQLPHVANDLRSWLDSQTNATIDRDAVLAWPWQVQRTPAAP